VLLLLCCYTAAANISLPSTCDLSVLHAGDLGVAKLLDTSTAFAQSLVGTPYYLSPELCADLPYRDKSDVWAFGVILYEVQPAHPPTPTSLCYIIICPALLYMSCSVMSCSVMLC
jgi:serine/threonine protein kinase